MTIRIHQIVLSPDEDESLLADRAAARVGVSADAVESWTVARRSVDARGGDARLVYSVDVSLKEAADERDALRQKAAVPVEMPEPVVLRPGDEEIRGRPVVVGCGPAGLFAALTLARMGYEPLLLERGAPVGERNGDIEAFHASRTLDPDSNYLFGAGGAGAYSDGKLYTRIRDPRVRQVLDALIGAGAPESLRTDARPHVGADLLGGVTDRLCEELLSLEGEIAWHDKLLDVGVSNGALRSVRAASGTIETNCLILAIGAAGRDTFAALHAAGVAMEGKPFQMGARIEHARGLIDRALHGSHAGHPRLGAAEYVLSADGVTTFCVCPGGVVMSVPVEPETVCTNGMSRSGRDGDYTNAALVTTVTPEEYGPAPLDGIAYQRLWERKGYDAGGGGFAAPAQTASDFVLERAAAELRASSYPFELSPANLGEVLPPRVSEVLRKALAIFDRRIPGFAGAEGLLVGPETRASCPVRIVRDAHRRVSATVDGLYPVGEGAGYAGGIVSSAVDGMRSAEAVVARFAAKKH